VPSKGLKIFGTSILYILIGILFSCKRSAIEKNQLVFPSKITRTKTVLIPTDSTFTPVILMVDKQKLKRVLARESFIAPINSNRYIVRQPQIIAIGRPTVITPGTDTFLIPSTSYFVDSPFIGKTPEQFVAKNMTFSTGGPANFSTFGKQHGLKHGIVTCMMQDRLGNIWIGTAAGVTKYDGRSFSNYTSKEGLSVSDVRSMLEDRSGNIWFGTLGGGVTRFDGRFFSHFTERQGLKNSFVTSILQDRNGNIWLATWGGGVVKYDGKSFTSYTLKQGLIGNYVSSIIEDRIGNLWFGTSAGLSKFNGFFFTNFTEKEGLSNKDVHCIFEDKTGCLWIGTEKGASKFDGKSFKHFTDKVGLIHNAVFSILQDRFGNVWFGTMGGISKFNGTYFTNYTELDGLGRNIIYCMLEDRAGTLWFGTAGGGVSKFNQPNFTRFTENHGLTKNFVSSIGEDHLGNIWLGTWGGGITKFNGKAFISFTDRGGLINNSVFSVCTDKYNNIWLGTAKGVVKYDGKLFTYFTHENGLINDEVNSIKEDKVGNLWFATSAGVSKFDGKTFTNYTEKEGLCNNHVSCIQIDHLGNIWFGTSTGISKFDGSFSVLRDGQGFTNLPINSILEDVAGNLWFGTNGNGLLKYDGEYLFQLTEKEGLCSNEVNSAMQDSEGYIWLGTSLGLSRLTTEKRPGISEKSRQDFISRDDISFKNYNYWNGFLGVGCTSNTLLESKGRNIWVGTNQGVTVINPNETSIDTTLPDIQITAVKLFNENVDWTELGRKHDNQFLLTNGVRVSSFHFDSLSKWYSLPQRLSLNYNNNNISFDFIGIAIDQPENIRYQYRLQGFEANVNPLTKQNSVSYANLPPGDYKFIVRAVSSTGYWSNQFNYPFEIRPPWWKTLWFRIFAVAALLVFLFCVGRIIYGYQLRKQKIVLEKQLAIQYERQRISADLHDEIGSTLSSINIYTALLKSKVDNNPYLDSINQNVADVISKLDDLVWSINPRYDSISSLVNRLNSFSQPLAAARGIECSIVSNPASFDVKIPTEAKTHIYMVAKELVNNAVKHSKCKVISIVFSIHKNSLKLIVNDDGVGFDTDSAPTHRNGLHNIAQRVHSIDGTLNIVSKEDFGTQTTVDIPL
jgi:ligand-binding sensor domain-containing protein